jgi:hypothetical protein
MEPSNALRPTKMIRMDLAHTDQPAEAVEHNTFAPIQEPPHLAVEVDIILQQYPELTEVRHIVLQILEASAENKSIVDFRNPRKAQLNLILQTRKQEFLAYCERKQLVLKKDEGNEPLVFQSIHETAMKLAGEQRQQQMTQLIRLCRGPRVLTTTRPEAIPELYQVCVQENNLITSIRSKLDYLRQRSGLHPEILERYALIVDHTGWEERPLRIRIADNQNLLMGYSIFDLLYSIKIRGDQYYGEMEFTLTDSETVQLNTYLSSLVTWIDDFTNILADLLGPNENPHQYIELAQRTLREILNHPIRMSPGVTKALARSDLPTCLIMGHLSLNLARHPHRDFLKAKFQELYDSEHVLDSAGEPKHFHLDEPYRSNMGLIQLRTICPGLNKLIKLQQLTTNFTGADNLEDALNTLKDWNIPNELHLIIQYKIQNLNDTYRMALGNQTPHNTAFLLDQALADLQELVQVEAKSLELCKTLLMQHTALYFRTADGDFNPTPEQMVALYDGERNIRYRGDQRHRNIAKLFTKLRNTPSIIHLLEANEGFSNALTELKSVLIARLNEYHTLEHNGVFGQAMVDETIQYFEQYVARIVYANESRVTAASIDRSLEILSGIIGSDLQHGCNQGLAGRMKDVLIALTKNTGDDLRDHIRQFQRECLEVVFQQNYSSENSMLARYKGQIADYLGLSLIGGVHYNDLTSPAKNLLCQYLTHCTPWTVYKKAYQFLSDLFWQLNSENNDEGIYHLLDTLQFEGTHEELDKRYRVNGDPTKRWQYAFFQQDLPRQLIGFLTHHQYLVVKPVGNDNRYLQRDNERLTHFEGDQNRRNEAEPPPQQELAEANPRRYGYVPDSALPNYDRMTS